MKDIIQSFLPWILYFILIGPSQQQLTTAIIVATAVFLFFGFRELRKGFILSWGSLFFFVFMFIAIVIIKNTWVAGHAWIFSNGTLALIAWISLFIGQPFTLQYAKEMVLADRWQHPIFIRINQILTAMWGSIFLFSVGVHVLRIYYPAWPSWLYEVLSDGATVMGVWFTTWFPSWYRKRKLKVEE